MGPDLVLDELELETEHICTDCEKDIAFAEEVYLIQIVQPKKAGGSMLYFPVIDENDIEGAFLFEPYIYCFDCWDQHYHDLKQEAEDIPPVQDDLSVIECVCCGSGVREWEYAGLSTLGELHISSRMPSNAVGSHFQPASKAEVICLYCMAIINDNYVTMWDELSQFGECVDCLRVRCWRYEQRHKCGCGCHEATENQANE